MAVISEVFDTQVVIYRRVDDGPSIGLRSRWATEAHPNTGKVIDGFYWDQRKWTSDEYQNTEQVAPTLWDPSTTGIEDYLSPGIGDNNDLYVTSINSVEFNDKTVWNPRILHGYYYQEGNEYFLHSDDGVTDYVTSGNLVPSGGNYVQLSYDPKSGVPIVAAGFQYNRDEGFYEVDRVVRKRVDFTGQYVPSGELISQAGDVTIWENVNTAFEEWRIDDSTSPPTAVFNQQMSQLVGGSLPTTTSGLSTTELNELDFLGQATGKDNEQFYFEFSPIDRTTPVMVYSDYLGGDHRTYTVVTEFTTGGVDQVKIDYDLGIATFGSGAAGGVPPYGSSIRAAYLKTIGLSYEPVDSRDYVEHVEADTNPVRRFSADGFVHLRLKPQDVVRLELEALLGELDTDFYGPLYMGNSFANIQATAYSQDEELVEGAAIEFEILSVGGGAFGTSDTATAITNSRGQARTLFNPPRSIEQMGGVTDQVIPSGGGSSLFLDDYIPGIDGAPLSLFEVARSDNILGIPKSGLKDYYEDFLANDTEMTVDLSGGGFGPAIDHELDPDGNFAWLGSAYERWIKWEVWHREVHGLSTPIVYEYDAVGSAINDLRTGKKTVVSKYDSTAINPHTGNNGAFVPVQPDSYTTTASGSSVYFSDPLNTVTEFSIHKGYMIVGPSKVTLRARTFNERLNQYIYSNEIDILVDIPDASRGLFQIDTINSVPSGLLANANYLDQGDIPLEPVELTTSGLLPLGWRLRSTGITLASALDGITFLDLNPLPQDPFPYSGLTHEIEMV